MTETHSTINHSVLVYLPYATSKLEGVIQSVHEAFHGADDYEIILLDDGTGQGKELAGPSAGVDAPFRVISFGKCFGESVAIDAGLDLANGRMIVTIPGTRPVSVEDIQYLAQGLLDGTDLCIGYRSGHWNSWFDHLQMKVFYWLTRRATGATFKDLSSGMRSFRREVAEEIALYSDLIRFLPILASGRGYRVEEFPLHEVPLSDSATANGPSRSGKSGIGLQGPAAYLNRILDVFTLFFLLRFTRKPLRFFGTLGTMLLVPGLLIDVYLFVHRFVTHEALAGRPMLLLGILLTVLGVQTISIGLIGEMIIFTHSREIRDFSIREVLD